MGLSLRSTRRTDHCAQPSRLATEAALELRMTSRSVEQLIHGHSPIHERMAAIIRAAVRLHDNAMLSRLMCPIEAALTGLNLQDRTFDQTIAEAVHVDSAEDLATKEFLRTRSRSDLEVLRRRVRTEVGAKQRLLAHMDAVLAEPATGPTVNLA